MGADLYIKSIYDPNREKYEPLFEAAVMARDKANELDRAKLQKRVSRLHERLYSVGYFRDSYNGTSVFWRMGMSWWKCPYINDEGYIVPEDAAKLLSDVKKAKIEQVSAEWLLQNNCSVDDGENSPESWNKYYAAKKRALCAFLRTAIKLGESIYASV